MTPDERAALRDTDPEPRAWFWPTSQLDNRWMPIQRGADEFARRTVGLRVPGGIWWIALWRHRGWSGPCVRCRQWDPSEVWEAPYCHSCTREVSDYAFGCLCPSFLEDDWSIEEWPHPDCVLHGHRVRQ